MLQHLMMMWYVWKLNKMKKMICLKMVRITKWIMTQRVLPTLMERGIWKEESDQNSGEADTRGTSSFDTDGVKLGIHKYQYHGDCKNNHFCGKSLSRNTSTGPRASDEVCHCRLHLDVKFQDDGYIFLNQGTVTGFYPSPKSFWSCTHVNSYQKYTLYINLQILLDILCKATSNIQESRKSIKSLKK